MPGRIILQEDNAVMKVETFVLKPDLTRIVKRAGGVRLLATAEFAITTSQRRRQANAALSINMLINSSILWSFINNSNLIFFFRFYPQR